MPSKTTEYTHQRINVTKDHVAQNLLAINTTCQTQEAVHTLIHSSLYQKYTYNAPNTVDSYCGTFSPWPNQPNRIPGKRFLQSLIRE